MHRVPVTARAQRRELERPASQHLHPLRPTTPTHRRPPGHRRRLNHRQSVFFSALTPAIPRATKSLPCQPRLRPVCNPNHQALHIGRGPPPRPVPPHPTRRLVFRVHPVQNKTVTLRRIGERVALSAAKAARSCARGQQSLTAIASGAASAPAPALAAAGGWKVGDRFLAGSRSGVVVDVPQAGARVVGVRWDRPIDIGRGETVTESRLRTGEMKDPATGRTRPQQVAPPVRAASGSGRGVDTTTVPGLTIVDVGTVPTSADELRALTAGHAEAFEADPKASTAKKWVKSALLHLGLEAVSLSAKSRRFDDLGGGRRVFVTVLLPVGVEGEATDDRLRLVAEATPRGLSVEDWDYAQAGARRAKPRVVADPTQAPAAEGEVDAEKDKALLDAFSAAIAAAMAG